MKSTNITTNHLTYFCSTLHTTELEIISELHNEGKYFFQFCESCFSKGSSSRNIKQSILIILCDALNCCL